MLVVSFNSKNLIILIEVKIQFDLSIQILVISVKMFSSCYNSICKLKKQKYYIGK